MSFTAPDGYQVYLNDLPADLQARSGLSGSFSHDYTLEIRPVASGSSAGWGTFSGVALGKSVTWEVGLGTLRTGRGAGSIIFKEADISATAANRALLYYTPPLNVGQISVVKDGPATQTLRQIRTPLGYTDLVDVTGGYEINFYESGQLAGTSGPLWTFSGSPWKTIRVETLSAGQLKITETEGSSSPVVRVSNLTQTGYVTAAGATGGTITTSGSDTVHTFTASGTFVNNGGIPSVSYLVVGGGGGGGNGYGGGGGAGDVQTGTRAVSSIAYAVAVGGGGTSGGSGAASSFNGVSASGGGAGGGSSAGSSGGSGGGGGPNAAGGAAGTGSNVHAGGAGDNGGHGWTSGGGGGAGTAGNGLPGSTFSGGNGITSSITGTSTYYGGGGGGAPLGTGATTSGGLGGGGNGNWQFGYPGTANTGGGGGGGANGYNGGVGGSGIVVLRYATPSGTAGVYTWTLEEGDATTVARITKHTSSIPTTGQRDVMVENFTKGSPDILVAKTKYHYAEMGWGEELGYVTTDPDASNPSERTTTYTYYTDAPTSGADEYRGNYRRVKSITYPSGNWAAWHYFNDWDQRGQLHYEFHPYLDAPSAPPSIGTDSLATTAAGASNNGRVVTLAYTYDWTGRWRELYTRTEKINNVQVVLMSRDQDYDSSSTLARMRYNQNAYSDSTHQQVTSVQYYRADAGDPDLVGELLKLIEPSVAQTSHGVSRGTYNPTTKGFSLSGAGDDWREVTFHGSATNDATWGTPASVTGYDFQPCDAVWMIPNKSTVEVSFRRGTGLLVRTENYIYVGGGTPFSLLKSEEFTYDGHGNLTERLDSNGVKTTYTWTKGRLMGTIDPTGIETGYTYDEVGRVKTATKVGASGSYPTQGNITTTYTYDGANHIKQTVVTGGSLSLTSSATFDLSGRPLTTTAPGSYVTSFAYTSGGKVVTATLPGNATKITETYPDGQAKSITGTAVVAQFASYSVNGSTGNITTQLNFGTSNAGTAPSARLVKTTADWLGRAISEVKPGWNGSDVTRTWTYNYRGLLMKMTQPGLADTIYEYDGVGTLVREGLDLNANGTFDLASDRVVDHASAFFPASGNWWQRHTTSTYATTGSATATQTGKVETQLTGFPTNRFGRTDTYDIFGNVTTQTVDVNRTGKLVTTTTEIPEIPGSTNDIVQIAFNGLVVSGHDQAGNTTTFGYDALGRQTTTTDPRKGADLTVYRATSSEVEKYYDPFAAAQLSGTPGFQPTLTNHYDAAGRVDWSANALGKKAYASYTTRNEVERQWGETTVPVEYGYDNRGLQTTMKTYRGGTGWTNSVWPTAPGTADITTWAFQETTGLLSAKTDAANKSVNYTYTQAGQIKTRAWARIFTGTTPVTTTYDYSTTTGELLTVDYNDSTTDLAYTYNRLGNIKTVTDMTGTRTFNYSSGTLELQSEDLPSFFLSKRITYPRATTGVVGRPTGVQLGTSGSPSASQSVVYDYDGYGRFNSLAGGGQTFSYGYEPYSNLVKTIANTATSYTDTRAYDPKHDWVDNRQTTIGSVVKAEFAYVQDNLGRITSAAKTGEVFNIYGSTNAGLNTAYDYTDRSEVKSEATKLIETAAILSGRDDAYAYDPMGNRASTAGTTHNVPISGTPTALTANYTTNALNQYTARSRTVPGYFDVAGALAPTTIKVGPPGVPTDTATRHGNYFFDAWPLSSTSAAAYAELEITDGAAPTTPLASLKAFVAAASEALQYDLDGNLTRDGRWNYYYDAENRLAWIETTAAAYGVGVPIEAWSFYYDYLGRRAWKNKYVWVSGAWQNASEQTRFIYDGWNVIAESDGFTITKNYYWGMDIAGPGQRAGGVGGLLMIQESTGSYLPAYDSNGNVHGLITTASVVFAGTTYPAGSLVAAYEYDAFGKTLREVGPYAAKNAFRYSTKYADLETGLVYYGLRFYSPTMGRFINKDPIEEAGGLNLYGFCGNDGIGRWDYLGMEWDDAESRLQAHNDAIANYNVMMQRVNSIYGHPSNWDYTGYGSSIFNINGDDGYWVMATDLSNTGFNPVLDNMGGAGISDHRTGGNATRDQANSTLFTGSDDSYFYGSDINGDQVTNSNGEVVTLTPNSNGGFSADNLITLADGVNADAAPNSVLGDTASQTVSGAMGSKNGPFAVIFQGAGTRPGGITGGATQWQVPKGANGAILARYRLSLTLSNGQKAQPYSFTEAWPVANGVVYKYNDHKIVAGVDTMEIRYSARTQGVATFKNYSEAVFVPGFTIDPSLWSDPAASMGGAGMYTRTGWLADQDKYFVDPKTREVNVTNNGSGFDLASFYVNGVKVK